MKNIVISSMVLSFLGCQPAPSVQPLESVTTKTSPPSNMRQWGPEQATGAPNTMRAGDIPTAWATLAQNAGPEWLKLDYEKPVKIAEIRIRETFNPGAVCKVAAILQDGREHVIWEGQDPTSEAPSDFVVKCTANILSKSVKIYLDTTRKPGWNEIDAVELIGKDKSRQWASIATASSTYADKPSRMSFQLRQSDPFIGFYGKRANVHLDNGQSITGRLIKQQMGFLVLRQKNSGKTFFINVNKIVYVSVLKPSGKGGGK